MSLDGNGRYCYLDPREGAKLAVAECCRNLATTGAVPVAATNNLNFGNPERPEIMAQLVEAIEGIAEACAFFEAPITGGNVSLYNETLGEGIYPTPVLGIIGLMKTAIPRSGAVPQRGRADSSARRPRRESCPALRQLRVRESHSQSTLGAAAAARHGSRKTRPRLRARNPRRGAGRIRARPQRWRPGRGTERMLHQRNRREGDHCIRRNASNSPCSARRRPAFC